MNREKALDHIDLPADLLSVFKTHFYRSFRPNDEVFDRWKSAKAFDWSKRGSVYNSSFIHGKVQVVENSWIGPFTIIDGSGGLTIHHHCTASADIRFCTYSNLKQTLNAGGKLPIECEPVEVDLCNYIAPQFVIQMGLIITSHSVIAANSFVNQSFYNCNTIAGNLAKQIGQDAITYNDDSFDHTNTN